MAADEIERMDDDQFQHIVQGLIDDAIQYTDGELLTSRTKAAAYLAGKVSAETEEGRSSVVMTEVRDAIRGMEPSILRVLFGAERAVEFVPTSAKQAAQAEQATEYIQHVFDQLNSGFLRTKDVLRDGLSKKLGIFKWGWDDSHTTEAVHLTGVTQSQLEQLAQQDDVTLGRIVQTQAGVPALEGQPVTEATFDVQLSHTVKDAQERIWSIPPEEFLFSREARDVETALMVGHRTEKTTGELLAMGVSMKDIEAHGGLDDTLVDGPDETARHDVSGTTTGRDPEAGSANTKHSFYELYPRIDFDGDGVAELRKVCAIGSSRFVISKEPVDHAPFSVYTYDPEPHALIGASVADHTMDLQDWKTGVVRATNDSLAQSIFPRVAYVEGQVNPHDILNNAIGAPVRMRAPGMVQPLTIPFTGQAAFPLLEYIDAVMERRTGQNAGAAGLDADALQSSTRQAVGAAVNASQEAKELSVRIFAEMALKPMFRGLYRMICAKPPKARMVKLRGQYVEIDPATWNGDMEVAVKVALGASAKEEKVALLGMLAQKQEQVLQMLGPSNPIFTFGQYANTIKQGLILGGIKDTAAFINDVPADWQPPAPQGPPPPTPEQTLAQAQLQIEQMKTQKDLQIKQAELTLKQEAQRHAQDLAVAEAAANHELRLYEINAKYGAQYTQQQFDRDIQTQQAALQGHLQAQDQQHQQAVDAHNQQLAAEQQAHDQQIAQQQADQAAQPAAPQGTA